MDCLLCFLSGLFVFWLFFRGAQTLGNLPAVTRTLLLYTFVNAVFFKVFSTYSGIIRYSSFVDMRRIAYAMGCAFIVVWLIHYPVIFWRGQRVLIPLHTRHIICIYIVSTIAMWMMRVLVKSLYDVSFSSDKGLRTMIYGVKDGGVGLAKNIRNEKPSRFQLKGFITGEHSFDGRVLMGVKVHEVDDRLANALRDLNIQAVLVSPLQTKSFQQDQQLQDLLIGMGIRIYMAPQSREWRQGEDFTQVELREISIEDLLPRDEIKVDMQAIGDLLIGRRIMITGSAGSIGSELVRQIAVYGPEELVLVDQAETPQHDMRLMMAQEFPDIKAHTIVASIVNEGHMEYLFDHYRPDYVFHAAAYKHVPMMEDDPSESVLNNVWGTKVLADLSVKYGVKKFVMISTDKAVNPTNVMGCSKRICEIYVQSLNNALHRDGAASDGRTQFVTTRFGNVLGSNGSVIPLFDKQIKHGGPVTVTDPRVIRYFMLISEACKLVLEAGTHGKGGEIFVFDMGQPVKIDDLAKRMIALSGAKGVQIKYTGLRKGEKLFEEVLSKAEDTLPSFHDKIRIAKVREYDYQEVNREVSELIRIAKTYDDMAIVRQMKLIVPEYISNNSDYTVLDRSDDTVLDNHEALPTAHD